MNIILRIGIRKSVLLGTEMLAFLMTLLYGGFVSTKEVWPVSLSFFALVGILTAILVRENKTRTATAEEIATVVLEMFDVKADLIAQDIVLRVMELLPTEGQSIESYQVREAVGIALTEAATMKPKRIRRIAGK